MTTLSALIRRLTGGLLLLLTAAATAAAQSSALPLEVSGKWYQTNGAGAAQALVENEQGEAETILPFAGFATIYLERPRETLRPAPEEFRAAALEIQVRLTNRPEHPVQGHLFVKNKDGLWFQAQAGFVLTPGDAAGGPWQSIRVELAGAACEFRPLGHEAAWSSLHAVTIQTIGLSLYGEPGMTVALRCRPPVFVGTRIQPALHLEHWRCPEQGETWRTVESRFELSREYFNPFDPEEIRVDVEVMLPGGGNRRWPAFFTQDYRRELRVNQEVITPCGRPYWAFRFTPELAGSYRLRLLVEDNSDEAPVKLASPWRRLNVVAGDASGPVRISAQDRRYFELANGGFFYPIGYPSPYAS